MIKRLAILIIVLLVIGAPVLAAAPAHVSVLRVEGQIDPSVADYLKDGIQSAGGSGAQAVLIVMNTPGGLITSMQKIVDAIFSSKLPVIVYVAPRGWAGSAGTMITMSANVAAMAPDSSIGAATPVSVGPGGESGDESDTLKRKQINFFAAYARSIAQKRGRNAKWADAAVRQASSMSAPEALKGNVIDLVADSVSDLMTKIDGRQVKMSATKTVVLHTAGAPLKENPMGAWDTFLHVLASSYVTLFLTLMAMYGIIYELANPGSIFPGVIGAISVLLLLYSYSVIPVNTVGFAFVALAIALFAIDLFTPTHGVLTTGGVVSMFFGLMMLFRNAEGFMVSITTIAVVALATGAFFFFLIGLGVRSLKKPYIVGREGVVGHTGQARTELDPAGHVFIDGALWTATSEEGCIAKGEPIVVTEMDGLRLKVRRADKEEASTEGAGFRNPG